MRISNVIIRNFRSLVDVKIPFEPVTSLIGPNGSGKSSVLRALHWFFNGKPGDITDDDCSFRVAGACIEVIVSFADATDEEQSRIREIVPEAQFPLKVRKIRDPKGDESLYILGAGNPLFKEIKDAPNATQKKELYEKLRENTPGLGLEKASTGGAVDTALANWIRDNPSELQELEEDVTGRFSFAELGLLDFVFISADFRAQEEAQDGRGSLISEIIGKFIDRRAADEQIEEIVERSRQEQQAIYVKQFKSDLEAVAEKINVTMQPYNPGREIRIEPADVELRAPRVSFNLTILDGESQTTIERQGHGLQRTLLISALQLLSSSNNPNDGTVMCLAIEEPELYQHPVQAQAFSHVLRELTENSHQNVQVVYATHSPYFVEPRNFHQVRRLVRTKDSASPVKVHHATPELVVERLQDIVKPNQVKRQLDGMITDELSVALFAELAVLVEGGTDAAVLYGSGDRYHRGHLESLGIAVVPVGKSSIPLANEILNSLGIPTYALFDADGGYHARAHAKGKPTDKIEEEKSDHIRLNHRLLGYFGLTTNDFPEQQATEHVAVFSDVLETYLESQWPEWGKSFEDLEAQLGMPVRKNQQAYRVATRLTEGPIPEFLQQIFERISEKVGTIVRTGPES